MVIFRDDFFDVVLVFGIVNHLFSLGKFESDVNYLSLERGSSWHTACFVPLSCATFAGTKGCVPLYFNQVYFARHTAYLG